MKLEVYVDLGSGWIELTNYNGEGLTLVRKEGLSKTEILHKDGKSVINTCSFKTDMPVSLASALINLDADAAIKLDINVDDADWFTGYARPVTSFSVNVESGYVNRVIQWEGVDTAWGLKNVLLSEAAYTGKKVCDPADTDNSLVHLLLTHAGYSSSDWNISTTISSVVDSFVADIDDREYFDLISDLLYYYGAVLNVAADGRFELYRWADDSVPEKTSLASWGTSESSFSADRNDIDSNRVQVEWTKLNNYTDRVVVSAKPDFDVGYGGEYNYPPSGTITHAIDREIDNGDKIISASNLRLQTYIYDAGFIPNEDKSVKKWLISNSEINFAIRNKYKWYRSWDKWADITFIPNLDDWEIAIRFLGLDPEDLEYYQLESPYDYPEDVIGTHVPTSYFFNLHKYRVLADIQTEGKRYTSEKGTGAKLVTVEADWIYSEADANNLAQAVLDLREISSKTFVLRLDEDVPIGTYRRLQNVHLNIDTVVRVKRKSDDIESGVRGYKIYQYVVEAVQSLDVLTTNISEHIPAIGITNSEAEESATSTSSGLLPSGQVTQAIESRLIEEGFAPDEDGLYLTSESLGFYSSADDEWTARIKDDGTFKFLGDADNFIEWDGAALHIQGDLKSANYAAGSAGWQLNNAGDAELNNVTVRGTVYATAGEFTGTITADSGEIGGFQIGATRLEDTAGKIGLDSSALSLEIKDASAIMKMIVGYMGNAPVGWLNKDGVQLGSDDFGIYVAGGNAVIADGAKFENGDYLINHDAAYKIVDSAGTERGRFGLLETEKVGLKVGTIDYAAGTGSGVYVDEDGNAMFRGDGSGLSGVAAEIADGSIELAKLGSTIIEGGYLKNNLIQTDIIQTKLLEATGEVVLGYEGSGTPESPDEGDRKWFIDGDEIANIEYTSGAWSSVNQLRLGGTDEYGNYIAVVFAKGVINPLADRPSGEHIPSDKFYYLDFESGFEDQYGNTPDAENLIERTTDWSKFGDYSLSGEYSNVGNLNYDGRLGLANNIGYASYIYPTGTHEYDTTTHYIFSAGYYRTENTYLNLELYYINDGDSVELGFLLREKIDTTVIQIKTAAINISLNDFWENEHYVGGIYNASELTITIVHNTETETVSIDELTITEGPTYVNRMMIYGAYYDDYYSEPRLFQDDVIFAYDDACDIDLLVQHYNHGVPWDVDAYPYTAQDLLLISGPNGAIKANGARVLTEADIGMQLTIDTGDWDGSNEYTIENASTNVTVFCTTGDTDRTLIVPETNGVSFTVLKADSGTGRLTVQGVSGTINGSASKLLVTQYSYMKLIGDGTNLIVDNFYHAPYDTGWVSNSDWMQVDLVATHNFTTPVAELRIDFMVSLDGTDAGVIKQVYGDDGGSKGYSIYQTSLDAIKIVIYQGIKYITEAYYTSSLVSTNAYYRIVVYKLRP